MTMKLSMTTLRCLLALGLTCAFLLLVAGAANAQPPVPHPVERGGASFEDCLGCHRAGIGDAPVPPDHRTYDNEACVACHGTPGLQPPSIPHPEDREDTPYQNCVGCHAEGLGDAPLMPADHQGHENEDCDVCHGAAGLAGPTIPHPAEREGTPFQDCVFCHRTGLVRAPVMAADHQAHDNEDCGLCHSTTGLAPPSIPHVSERSCADCHRTGAYGAPLLPADHQAHSEEDCFHCHSTTGLAAPIAPALMEGRQDCLSCHHDSVPEGVIALESSQHDHSVYTADTCLSCHRLRSETGIVEASTDETTGEVPADEVRFVSVDVSEDAGPATRAALIQRWATIIGVSAICVAIALAFKRS